MRGYRDGLGFTVRLKNLSDLIYDPSGEIIINTSKALKENS